MTRLQNFYKTSLTTNISAAVGKIYVATLPTESFGWLVISPNNETLREIIHYTSKGTDGTGNYVNADERGCEGTTAQTHSIGEPIRLNLVSQHWDELLNTIAAIEAVGAPDASETVKGIFEEATDAEVTAGTATGGTGAKLAITPTKLLTYLATRQGQYKNFTAVENLSVGTPVGISNTMDSYVGRAKTGGSSVAVSPSLTNTGGVLASQCVINTDKFVYVYHENGGSNLKAIIGTIDRSNTASPFTWGSAATITSTIVSGTYGVQTYKACKIDTDKFAVVYVESGATTVTKMVIATVSGTTITLGSAVTVDSSTNAVSGVTVCQIATDKGVVAIGKATNQRAYAFTVSGTVPTFGASAAMDANLGGATTDLASRKINTDKFVIVNSNAGYAQVGTISGVTITFGTAASYISSPTAYAQYTDVISIANDSFIVSCQKGTATNITACTVSGTTITAGTPIDPGLGNTSVAMLPLSSSTFYVFGGVKLFIYSVSGTVITLSSTVISKINTNSQRESMLDFTTYWMNFTSSTGTGTYFIKGMSNNFIGFVQSNALKDATVSVLLSGVDTHQTSLIAGKRYLVNAGALTAVDSDVTVNTLDDIDVVTALSATEVKF